MAPSTEGFSRTPASTMSAAPPTSSSQGWNISLTLPLSSPSRSFNILAAPRRALVWMSWPQACIQPLLEANVRPVNSSKGRASISALRRNVFPPASALPRTALIPAFPTFLNSIPYAFNFSATRAVVSGRSNPISGFWWIFLRMEISSSLNSPALVRVYLLSMIFMCPHPESKLFILIIISKLHYPYNCIMHDI